MILDTISRLPLYEALIPGAARIAEAFPDDATRDLPFEIRRKSYALKDDAQRRFEVHGRTIDLMLAREGAEIIHLCPADELVPAEALPGGADGRKLDGVPRGTAVLLEAGRFCAIFPGEAHMVGGKLPEGPDGIVKWVAKVPAPAEFEVSL